MLHAFANVRRVLHDRRRQRDALQLSYQHLQRRARDFFATLGSDGRREDAGLAALAVNYFIHFLLHLH
jgi:hypothetical protein